MVGVFDTPVGGSGAGVIFPGQSYSFTFEAAEGQMLSFAAMLVQSNDLFISTGTMGLELFESNGNAVTGDITSMLYLWDADTGAAENATVVKISNKNDGFMYPSVSNMVKVTIDVK